MDKPVVLNPELTQLVRDSALKQAQSLQPRAKRGRRADIPGGGSSENYRLIRGQSYGVQTGAFILLNNIVVLSGGLDPTNGNPAIFVRVANFFGNAFANGQWVDAVYSPNFSLIPPCDWETLSGASGVEKYRVIYGIAYSAANPATSSFLINNITVESGGADPRVDPTSSTETITVHKRDSISVTAGDNIAAAYEYATATWVMFPVERYRAIRGTWYSGTSTLLIDHIVVLDSGLDQRSDPTSDTEQISVSNIAGDIYGSGDKVWADFNHKDQLWEARPKAGSGSTSAVRWGKVTTAGSAASAQNSPTTDGRCTLDTDYGGTSGVTIKNRYPDPIPINSEVCIDGVGVAITWSCGTF